MQERGPSSADVIFVPANRVLSYWPHVRQYIWPAFEQFPGESTETEVLRKLTEGILQMVVVWKDKAFIGGALTKLEDYPGFRGLVVAALGGEQFEEWREEMDRVLDKFGTFHNCSRVEFHGRRGWERRLPNYKIHRIMMVRSI